MSVHIVPGDMVEGQKTEITARKIEFKNRSLMRHEITDKLMVTYSMDKNCSVVVNEKISLTDDEKKRREPHPIYGEVGDSIKADAIRLFVAVKRNIFGENVKEGVSGRHGATVLACPYHAIAKIAVPWQGHLNKLGMTSHNNLKAIK